ncbi:RNA-binding protein Jag [Hydrogenimonas sp.]|nr:RNA-binding protein Jag [Hydrogenimonas sp.]
MKKFEAPTLEEAYAAAAKEFSCSVTELDIQVVQNPSRGFLGFGRKDAIIVAMCKKRASRRDDDYSGVKHADRGLQKRKNSINKEFRKETSETRKEPPTREKASLEEVKEPEESEKKVADRAVTERKEYGRKFENEDIFGNFYDDAIDINAAVVEVEQDINRLFSSACFRIEPIRVFALDDETLQIEFKGEDAALLIGKEGYRYKAMAYLLYNWIHGKYGYKIRLEIAEFLKNQEAMIESYLQPVIERVESEGRAQTKVLDGILVQIALQKLREKYPDKYVAVRTNREGGRYVIVNEFMERR